MTIALLPTATMTAAIAIAHDPDAWKQRMVYSVWEDGEITLEKGGELFGQRNLHMQDPGDVALAWPVALFPVREPCNIHGRIFAKDEHAAYAFRALLLRRT